MTASITTALAALAFIGLGAGTAAPAAAQDASAVFATGPVFDGFGAHAPIANVTVDRSAQFRHAFDVSAGADGDALNRGFDSAARFVNMLVGNGIPSGQVRVAIVVHGAALRDLLTDEARAARDYGTVNPSGAMVRAMQAQGVRFIVCGQSAAGSGIAREDLIPGAEMALAAMTAHALLQQQGYTLNPF